MNRPWLRFARRLAFSLFALALFALPPQAGAAPVLKMISGRVKAVWLDKKEFVLTYRHPVTNLDEELVFKVDGGTGFAEGEHFEGLKRDAAVSVDYLEDEKGGARAVSVRKVSLSGVPIEKNPFL